MTWGSGMGGGRKDGCGSGEVYISTKGAILGFTRDLILEGLKCDKSRHWTNDVGQ